MHLPRSIPASSPALPRSFGLLQGVQRSRLAKLASSERIVTGIAVGAGGFVYPRTSTWRKHWARRVQGLSARIRTQLDGLHDAWRSYISSGFSANAAVPYCRQYSSLLRLALAAAPDHQLGSFLRALAGFEVFSVYSHGDEHAVGAIALALRHPVYLLSKLRQPRAYDDPKFLPLAACAASPVKASCRPGLYYHYRKLGLDDDSRNIMLVLPPSCENTLRRIG